MRDKNCSDDLECSSRSDNDTIKGRKCAGNVAEAFTGELLKPFGADLMPKAGRVNGKPSQSINDEVLVDKSPAKTDWTAVSHKLCVCNNVNKAVARSSRIKILMFVHKYLI